MSSFPAALPHSPLTPVCEGVHCVQGSFHMGPGMTIDRTMTVVQSGDDLVVLNPIRLSETGQAALDALGKVAHLVKLSDAHDVDEPYYLDRYQPTYWSLPGAKLAHGVSTDQQLGSDGPIAGGKVMDFGELSGPREGAYWIPHGGGTLITCDALQNCTKPLHASVIARMVSWAMGFTGGVIVPPFWRRMRKLTPNDLNPLFEPITALTFANLAPGHGPPVVGGADALVRAAVARVAG